MADDVTLNSMSGGSVVATDEVTSTGEHVQIVKLAQSADGDRTPIDADSNGLKVNVSDIAPLATPLSTSVDTIGGSVVFPVSDNGGSLTVDGTVGISGTVPVSDNGGSLTVDGTVAVSSVSGTVAATQSGGWTVTSNAGTGTMLVKRSHQPTPYKLNSAASTNATSVSTTANTLLYGYYISNTNSSVRYVKFYNKASAPTVGTDTPVLVLAIPGSGAANVSFPAGINFTTGLAFATTTGAADSDTAAVAANEVIVNLVYATY
jgi:hypothetical protein